MLAYVKMNLSGKNTGNKIIIKSYENDNGYWLCENINALRRSKIYIFDRVDVCEEYCEIKSCDIEDDNYLIMLVYNEKNNDRNKTYSNYNCMMVTNIWYMISIKSARLSEPYVPIK